MNYLIYLKLYSQQIFILNHTVIMNSLMIHKFLKYVSNSLGHCVSKKSLNKTHSNNQNTDSENSNKSVEQDLQLNFINLFMKVVRIEDPTAE